MRSTGAVVRVVLWTGHEDVWSGVRGCLDFGGTLEKVVWLDSSGRVEVSNVVVVKDDERGDYFFQVEDMYITGLLPVYT